MTFVKKVPANALNPFTPYGRGAIMPSTVNRQPHQEAPA